MRCRKGIKKRIKIRRDKTRSRRMERCENKSWHTETRWHKVKHSQAKRYRFEMYRNEEGILDTKGAIVSTPSPSCPLICCFKEWRHVILEWKSTDSLCNHDVSRFDFYFFGVYKTKSSDKCILTVAQHGSDARSNTVCVCVCVRVDLVDGGYDGGVI